MLKRRAVPSPAGSRDTRRDGSGPRPPWAWALAGVVLGLALTLAVAAPARWLATALARASGGAVQLSDTEGSLWNGSARLTLTAGTGSQDAVALPGRVHWRLRPAGAGLAAQLAADCCTKGGPIGVTVSPRWSGAQVTIADGRSEWPAAVLTGLGTPWNTLQPTGALAVSTEGLTLTQLAGRASIAGTASLTARDMGSRLSPLKPLGTYRVDMTGGEAPALALRTADGPLRLEGSGRWVGRRLRFTGEASAAPGFEAQLANLLNLLGRRQGERTVMAFG